MALNLRLTPWSLAIAALCVVLAHSKVEAQQKDTPAAKSQPAIDAYGDPLPRGALARLGTTRFRYSATNVAYSPDGKYLAAGGADNRIRLLDAQTGKEVRRLTGHQPRTYQPQRDPKSGAFDMLVGSTGAGSVSTLAFSPDGKTLASGGWDDMVRLWDVETGKEVRKMLAHQAMVARVAFSPDGKFLASRGGLDGVMRLWDPHTGAELRKIEQLSKVNTWRFYREAALAISPDSKIVAASDRKGIVLFDASTGQEMRRLDGYRDCMYLAFSPNGKLLASGGLDDGPKEAYSLRFWDPATGQELRRCELPKTAKGGTEPPTCFAFSPDGDRLMAAVAEMDTYLFDVATGKQLHRLHHNWAYRVAYAPDGKTVLSMRGPAFHLWDPASGHEKGLEFIGHQSGVMAVALSPDGRLVASAAEDIRLWDLATGKLVRKLPAGALALSFAPNGKTLASGGGRSVRLWDVTTGRETAKFDGPRLVRAVVFSPDGKRVASGDEQAVISIWDAAEGVEIRKIEMQALAESLSLAFSPDGKHLACAGAWNHFALGNMVLNLQGRVKVAGREGYFVLMWDVATGQEVRKFAGLRDNIKAVAFSPDGKSLAASSRDGRVVLWDASTGQDRLHIMAHPQPRPGDLSVGPAATLGGTFAATPALAFTPDGKTLVSAAPDQTIRAWDTATARELGQFQADTGGFSSLAVSRDGAKLITASPDTTILIWNLKAIGHAAPPGPKSVLFQ